MTRDYAYLNLIERRKRGFRAAQDEAASQSRAINEQRLDRVSRRQALDKVADELAAAQDRVRAQYPLPVEDLTPNAAGADHSHLDAIQLRLSHERARLSSARTLKEKRQREVWVAQAEKELADEYRFLGIQPDSSVEEMSDDDLMAELESNGSGIKGYHGLADLHRQGFMKSAFATPKKPKAAPKPPPCGRLSVMHGLAQAGQAFLHRLGGQWRCAIERWKPGVRRSEERAGDGSAPRCDDRDRSGGLSWPGSRASVVQDSGAV